MKAMPLSDKEFTAMLRLAAAVAADVLIPALKETFRNAVHDMEYKAQIRLLELEQHVSQCKTDTNILRAEVQTLRTAVETFARQQL